ncbi:alpha/beta hydrolase [soil metagenome]
MNSSSDTAPCYRPEGWTHWPAHPAWSQQFVRILGAAQEGAATVGECLLAASRMVPGDASSWHREWQRMAEENARRADAALAVGHAATARAHHLRASNYHRVSELFLAPDDTRRRATFAEVVRHSHAHLRLMSPPGEVVSIEFGDGQTLDAYLLKPSSASLAHRPPVVIAFGGLDGCKDEMVQRMASAALARGLALLVVDMPGQGEALRFRGMSNHSDTTTPVARCIDHLQARGDVDGERIALYGASLGGVYSARAASGETRLKAVVSDSLIFDLHAAFAYRLAADGDSGDWCFLQWVFGCESPADVVEKSRQFGMVDVLPLIRCPYLIVQGAHDFLGLQTALDAFDCAKQAGVPVELRVFDAEETGASHCQADNPTIGQAFICDWLADRLGAGRAQAGGQPWTAAGQLLAKAPWLTSEVPTQHARSAA